MVAAAYSWDGGANSDPVAALHAAIAAERYTPAPIILSESNYQWFALDALLTEHRATYRVRTTAYALLRLEGHRAARRSASFPWGASGPMPSAERVFAKTLALEPKP